MSHRPPTVLAEPQIEELLALQDAGLLIHGELGLETVLQNVVEQARVLVSARYGALAVVDEDYRIQSFFTSGVTLEERARMGDPPRGSGLLGVVLHDGQRLRLRDLRSDPRSAGFPRHHPAMRSLLAVPIVCKGPFRGNLYVTEKQGATEFSERDEEVLARLAATAAVAIDNADLHRRLQSLAVAEERLRIAREMHDGMAQVLAYVNTKAQAVSELLSIGRAEEARQQLEQLAEAAREIYADTREGILSLRTPGGPDQPIAAALRLWAAQWQDQSGVSTEVLLDDQVRLEPAVELQLVRIAQEALSNVRKHARARRAELRLQQQSDGILLEIIDDGTGFDPVRTRGGQFPRFGLATMRERAESVGATLVLDTAPGRGTRVLVRVPRTKP
ncbi:MAG: GAF domain-containing sensor histidine kinase [Acidobacteriota bacterium]